MKVLKLESDTNTGVNSDLSVRGRLSRTLEAMCLSAIVQVRNDEIWVVAVMR